MGVIYEKKMTLNSNEQAYTHKNYHDPKSRDKGVNVYSFVYIGMLKCLLDIFFIVSIFGLTFPITKHKCPTASSSFCNEYLPKYLPKSHNNILSEMAC